MKKIILIILTLTSIMGCGNTTDSENVMANASTSMKISGMTCEEMCAGRIEDKISRMSGVKSCEVDFENEIATVFYDKKKVDIDEVILKVGDMNDGQYGVSEVKTENIENTNSDINSGGGSETGQIITAPSFELPNLADYFRNIL
jgi:copper chaperone CopZ